MKWIAELMNMIAVVTIKTENKHQRIIAYFGPHALQIYGLPPDLEHVVIDYSNYKNLLHWCKM